MNKDPDETWLSSMIIPLSPTEDQQFEINKYRKNNTIDLDIEGYTSDFANDIQICESKLNSASENSLYDELGLGNDESNQIEDSIDPFVDPKSWWELIVLHSLSWLKEYYDKKCSIFSSQLLLYRNIDFFSWRPYESQIGIEGPSYSIVSLLKPWINSTYPDIPQGVFEQEKETEEGICIIENKMASIIEQLKIIFQKIYIEKPIESETLRKTIDSLIALNKKNQSYVECELKSNELKRFYSITIIHSIFIIQGYLYQETCNKFQKGVDCYLEYNQKLKKEYIDKQFEYDILFENLKKKWIDIKIGYEIFLKQCGMENIDPSVNGALDSIFEIDRENQTPIRSIKCMKSYIEYIKRISNSIKSLPLCNPSSINQFDNLLLRGGKINSPVYNSLSQSPRNINDDELHPVKDWQNKRIMLIRKIENCEKQLNELDIIEYHKTEEEIILQSKRELILEKKNLYKVLNTFDAMWKKYDKSSVDPHNKWIENLDKLEEEIMGHISHYEIFEKEKLRKSIILIEEAKIYFEKLMDNCYSQHEKHINYLLSKWKDMQLEETKKKTNLQKQIKNEKQVLINWIASYQKTLLYPNQLYSEYEPFIGEYKQLIEQVFSLRKSLLILNEFKYSFKHSIQICHLLSRECSPFNL